MNCRFATIDARTPSVTRYIIGADALMRAALQHCPGEGSGGSS